MKIVGGTLLAVLGILLIPLTASAEAPSSAVLANTCFSCHGTDGRSAGAMPSLAGKSPTYISQTLQEFRSGQRDSTVMQRIMKGFTDAEIEALADQLGAK